MILIKHLCAHVEHTYRVIYVEGKESNQLANVHHHVGRNIDVGTHAHVRVIACALARASLKADIFDARDTREQNPFRVPGDEEIFRHREEDKAKKEAKRTQLLSAPVADKSTFASRMQATTTDEVRELLQSYKTAAAGGGSMKHGPSVASTTAAPERRKEKENMPEFIAKKREIFLLQMSLDTKRAEIKKLDERARQREEALKKSEQMLEEDALRFDAFLKENDEKVQEAIKRAEMEAKAKQDKVRLHAMHVIS